ncbi:hypothetical protein KDI_03610 [Dictyobacter arantiisoli]|uniref:Uncharacterized protein n=1 Tax=Dictyobacter arantiisoli TaxID=2014874 RepID=A0A5A5T603_9CHLR|nr:hypothetical protein KDI_03610 [Dictyobacter arantiisoli]
MRHLYRRANDKAKLYIVPATIGDTWQAVFERVADKATQRLQRGSAPAPKRGFLYRFGVTLLCFLLGLYLLISTHPISFNGNSTVASAVATPAATSSIAKITASTGSLYAPGKGGVAQTQNTHTTTQTNQLAATGVTCDPTNPMSYYQAGCDFSDSNYQCTYNAAPDTGGSDKAGSHPASANDYASFHCTANGNTYSCRIADYTVPIYNLTCSYGFASTCRLADCVLKGITCYNADPKNPITGLPEPAPTTTTTTTNTLQEVCPVQVNQDCSIVQSTGSDVLTGAHGLLGETPAASTFQAPAVANAWQSMLTIVGALFTFALVVAGYQVLLGPFSSRYVNLSEAAGRVIIAGIAAVASLYVIGLLIALTNGLSVFVEGLQFGGGNGGSVIASILQFFGIQTVRVGTPSGQWGCNVQQFLGNIFNLSIYNLQAANKQITADQQSVLVYGDISTIVNHLTDYIMTLLTVVLAIQLMIRLVFLNGYIIISPLMIFCNALPGDTGASLMRHWLKDFLALLFVQVLQLFAVVALGMFFAAAQTAFGNDPWSQAMIGKMAPVVGLMIVLRVPKLLNSTATSVLSSISSSITGSVSGIILIVRGL